MKKQGGSKIVLTISWKIGMWVCMRERKQKKVHKH